MAIPQRSILLGPGTLLLGPVRHRHAARRIALAAGLAALALVIQPGAASSQVQVAPTVSWGEDTDLGLGAQFLVNLSRVVSADADQGLASKLVFVLPFEWFVDCTDCTYFELTPGLILPLTIRDVGPYVGTGINLSRLSVDSPGQDESDISVGLGLTGGFLFPVGAYRGFGEIRYTAGGRE